jgi:peptide deformylase
MQDKLPMPRRMRDRPVAAYRPTPRVRVSYRDLDGEELLEEADGLIAVCLQHEIDR